METSRDQPFSGDCISFQDTGVDLNTYATNFERFFNMLGLTDVVITKSPATMNTRTRAAAST